jgi:hypothetical protein
MDRSLGWVHLMKKTIHWSFKLISLAMSQIDDAGCQLGRFDSSGQVFERRLENGVVVIVCRNRVARVGQTEHINTLSRIHRQHHPENLRPRCSKARSICEKRCGIPFRTSCISVSPVM